MAGSYACLEQRMVQPYLDTFPPFVPSEGGPPFAAQEQFHGFMARLYGLLSEEPSLLVSELHEDDAHTWRFNASLDNKPKLKGQMRKMLREVDSLLAALFQLGQHGRAETGTLIADEPVKIGRKHRLILSRLGIRVTDRSGGTALICEQSPLLFQAWVWMAARPGASVLAFSRCFFREGHPYPSEIYARLLHDEAAFNRLENYLIGHGYTRYDNLGGQVALDYVNTHGDTAPVKGGFQYGIRYPGIAARYDLHLKEPQVIGLCIPRMKDVLANFAGMGEELQDFVAARTKHCDGCRYCVQTDKTGTRPLAFVTVSHAGMDVRLCPYFPGYDYCWSQLDDGLVGKMIRMLEFMEQIF